MSYCRWGSGKYTCHLYIYQDVEGGWTCHIADAREPRGVRTINVPTPGEMAGVVRQLRSEGFVCPDYVDEELLRDQAILDRGEKLQ